MDLPIGILIKTVCLGLSNYLIANQRARSIPVAFDVAERCFYKVHLQGIGYFYDKYF